MRTLIRLGFLPHSHDLGLLVLRIWLGVSLFIKHGLDKITGFSQMAAHFPDPLHIGARRTLLFSLLSDGICSVLLILGLGTRWAALFIAINTGAAFALVHHFQFFGEQNGEFAWLYMGGALTLFLAGGGRFSADREPEHRGWRDNSPRPRQNTHYKHRR